MDFTFLLKSVLILFSTGGILFAFSWNVLRENPEPIERFIYGGTLSVFIWYIAITDRQTDFWNTLLKAAIILILFAVTYLTLFVLEYVERRCPGQVIPDIANKTRGIFIRPIAVVYQLAAIKFILTLAILCMTLSTWYFIFNITL